jgi:O-acetyl-ADP-ribose deacetylase (regulator of RNase III)
MVPAAKIAIREVKEFLKNNQTFEKVVFSCYDYENYELYKELLERE